MRDYPDDAEVVITIPTGHELTGGMDEEGCITYYASSEIGHGWKPSNIIELTIGEFATG